MLDRRSFIKLGASMGAVTAAPAMAAPSKPAGASHVLTPTSVGLNDSRRFMDQATMGARPGEAAALTGSFSDWIEAQVALPYNQIDVPTMIARGFNNNPDPQNNVARMCIFARWCNEPAQLRMRVTHVLSQIICCAPSGWSNAIDSMLWWNRLAADAFGNYRSLLGLAVQHRHMGSFLNNSDNDASNGKAPSQNFARELLQLFSLGVHALNSDGSLVRDAAGRPVQAYFQNDVDALARLLCGWGLPFGVYMPGQAGTAANGTMDVKPALAYNGPPVTFLGRTFPAIAAPTAADVVSRAQQCIDLIIAQPTTSVYVSKQFITKMVTDTPSGAYIRRVSAVFRNNGAGITGDLKAVVRAVLTDPEARGQSKPLSFGRAQEWSLSLVKVMRYAQMQVLSDPSSSELQGWAWSSGFGNPPLNVLGEMGQAPGTPVSVFNDYPFEFLVNGINAPAAALWSAPSIMASVARTMALSQSLTQPLAPSSMDATGRWNLSLLVAAYDRAYAAASGSETQKMASTIGAMVDLVNGDLNQGRALTATVRQHAVAFVQVDCAALAKREKLAWMINFIRCLPDSAVVI